MNVCPNCHSAEAAAPRLPDLQARTAAARSSRSAPRPRSRVTEPHPRRGRRAGRRPRARARSSPARSRRRRDGIDADPLRAAPASTPAGSSSSRRRETIGMDEKPAEAVRGKPDSLARRRAAAPSPRARPTRSSRPGTPARCSPPGCSSCGGCRGVLRPAIAVAIPSRARPVGPPRLRARTPTRAPSTCSSSRYMGAIFAEEILELARPERAAALDRRGAGEGQPAHARGARAARRERPRLRAATPRAASCSRAPPTSSSRDGFTGNVALKLLEGTIRRCSTRCARRSPRRRAGKLGGLLIRPAARPLRDAPRPGHLRRRVPARPARPRRDRARQLVAPRDRERDPPGRARRRARRGRPARRSACRSGAAPVYDRARSSDPNRTNEVTWQRRVRKSSSGSRRS